jgi:5-methylcytosine-specific restriction endonuclease McrA
MKALCSCGSFAPLQDGKCRRCYSYKPKKEPTPLNQKKPKNSGQLAMFKSIFLKGNLKCEVCGKPITTFNRSNYHHVKLKSIHPSEKLNPDNIMILCFEHHYAIHNLPKDKQGIIK